MRAVKKFWFAVAVPAFGFLPSPALAQPAELPLCTVDQLSIVDTLDCTATPGGEGFVNLDCKDGNGKPVFACKMDISDDTDPTPEPTGEPTSEPTSQPTPTPNPTDCPECGPGEVIPRPITQRSSNEVLGTLEAGVNNRGGLLAGGFGYRMRRRTGLPFVSGYEAEGSLKMGLGNPWDGAKVRGLVGIDSSGKHSVTGGVSYDSGLIARQLLVKLGYQRALKTQIKGEAIDGKLQAGLVAGRDVNPGKKDAKGLFGIEAGGLANVRGFDFDGSLGLDRLLTGQMGVSRDIAGINLRLNGRLSKRISNRAVDEVGETISPSEAYLGITATGAWEF